MTRIYFWNDSNELAVKNDSDQPLPEEILKIKYFNGEYYLLDNDRHIWKGTVSVSCICLKNTNVLATDIAVTASHFYYVTESGRVFRFCSSLDQIEEVILHEEETSCIHGHITTSHRVFVKKISAGGKGVLFVSDGGELWAFGDHQQLNIFPEDGVKKVLFFEGRYVSQIGSGSDFNVIITHKRDDLSATHNGCVHSDSNEVFLSACPQCTNDIISPLSAQSDHCPLGVHFAKSSESISCSSSTSKNNEEKEKSDIVNSSSSADSLQVSENTEFEITQIEDSEVNGGERDEKPAKLVINTEAARQFLSKQLSWVSSGKDDWLPFQRDVNYFKTMASMVYEGVKTTVGDKVANLSRHMSGGSDNISEAGDEMNNCGASVSGSLSRWEWSGSEGCSEEGVESGLQGGGTILSKGSRIINSEVWTWGSSKQGQLGLGDTVSRNKPSLVTSILHIGVIDVSCGSQHCVVACLDGRSFSWGLNSHCQVTGVSENADSDPLPFVSSPTPCPRVLAAAAGPNFTVFLTQAGTLLWRGQPQADDGDNEKKGSWKNVLVAGNLTCAIISDSRVDSDLAHEQCYLEELVSVSFSVVRPLLRRSSLDDTIATLAWSHNNVLHLTSLIVATLQRSVPAHTALSTHMDLIIGVYNVYVSALSDALVVSSLSTMSRLVDLPDKLVSVFVDRLPSFRKTSPEAILACAFNQPLSHVAVYKGMVCRGGGSNLERWDQLMEIQETKRKEAEITRQFWETAPRNLEVLRTPGRRLLKESKSCPLNLQNAGRFSSHWFILFSDMLVHVSGSNLQTHSLDTIWVEQVLDAENSQNNLLVTMPEDSLLLVAPTHVDKMEWFQAFDSALKTHLKKPYVTAARTACHNFVKHNNYKDAVYTGRWNNGKLEGRGKMVWCDGRVYIGQFRNNQCDGYGRLEVPSQYTYEGQWKDGQPNGYGVTKYEDGDIYAGYYKDGQENGHGIKKTGRFPATDASVYVGEWQMGQRHGYGVINNIGTGEKYLGFWSNNQKHGSGLIVNLDGLYYEGTFEKDVLIGHGVIVFDDGSHYEGEVKEAGVFAGKGTLTFSSGDRFEGTLHGTWNQGIKISGTLHKNLPSHPAVPITKPKSFGQLCVSADKKWCSLFKQTWVGMVVGSDGKAGLENQQVWENIAITMSGAKRKDSKPSGHDSLHTIPTFGRNDLDSDSYNQIINYLNQAFECSEHPLGRTLNEIVDAYTTTYGGVLVHPLLLAHAVSELHSITLRLYQVVRELFPALPHPGICPIALEDDGVISPATLLHPIILPKVYSCLLILYSLHNKTEDETYWRRLLKWNRHPDSTLLAFLSIDKKFWMSEDGGLKKENLFKAAIETLQQLKTTFSPMEKLLVLRKTFEEIPKAVKSVTDKEFVYIGMDDLLPIFQYVVVRSHIQALGSEINFIDDFMEPTLKKGEMGIMFTTLQACFSLILQEKININQY